MLQLWHSCTVKSTLQLYAWLLTSRSVPKIKIQTLGPIKYRTYQSPILAPIPSRWSPSPVPHSNRSHVSILNRLVSAGTAALALRGMNSATGEFVEFVEFAEDY